MHWGVTHHNFQISNLPLKGQNGTCVLAVHLLGIHISTLAKMDLPLICESGVVPREINN